MNQRAFEQTGYKIRFEWGQEGTRRLAPLSDVVVIIDVLSFTTCVDIAVSQGAVVFPYPYKDESAISFAHHAHAELAGERGSTLSLSPASMLHVPSGSRFVLPSQNGAICTLAAAEAGASVTAGCLRNAAAVADYISGHFVDGVITVIACGEHWEIGRFRPAIEDFIGAGAILSHFDAALFSPEAESAVAVFQYFSDDLQTRLAECSSGRELIAKGFPDDVAIAAELNVSRIVPMLRDGAYVRAGMDGPGYVGGQT